MRLVHRPMMYHASIVLASVIGMIIWSHGGLAAQEAYGDHLSGATTALVVQPESGETQSNLTAAPVQAGVASFASRPPRKRPGVAPRPPRPGTVPPKPIKPVDRPKPKPPEPPNQCVGDHMPYSTCYCGTGIEAFQLALAACETMSGKCEKTQYRLCNESGSSCVTYTVHCLNPIFSDEFGFGGYPITP